MNDTVLASLRIAAAGLLVISTGIGAAQTTARR